MNNPEIILNLWYVLDDDGIIYSLRARAYVGQGSDDEKLELRRRFATIDYLVARPFPVPEAFHVTFGESGTKMTVAYRPALNALGNPIAIFEEAIKILESDLPAQTKLEISARPLVCITTLVGDDDGNMRAVIAGSKRF